MDDLFGCVTFRWGVPPQVPYGGGHFLCSSLLERFSFQVRSASAAHPGGHLSTAAFLLRTIPAYAPLGRVHGTRCKTTRGNPFPVLPRGVGSAPAC